MLAIPGKQISSGEIIRTPVSQIVLHCVHRKATGKGQQSILAHSKGNLPAITKTLRSSVIQISSSTDSSAIPVACTRRRIKGLLLNRIDEQNMCSYSTESSEGNKTDNDSVHSGRDSCDGQERARTQMRASHINQLGRERPPRS